MGKEALLGIHHKSRLRRNGRSDDRLGAVGFGPAVVQFPSLENPLHRPNASPPWSRARQQAVARGCDNRSLTVAAPGRLFSSSWVACKAIRYSVATPTRKPAPPAECVAAPEPRASGAVKKSPVERERRSRHASPLRTIVCFQRRRGLACQARLAGIGSPTFFHSPSASGCPRLRQPLPHGRGSGAAVFILMGGLQGYQILRRDSNTADSNESPPPSSATISRRSPFSG